MNATMSVDQYRKEVRDPAIAREVTEDRETASFVQKMHKAGILAPNEQKIKEMSEAILPTRYAKNGAVNVVLKNTDKPERQHIEDDHAEMVAGYLELLMMQHKVAEYTHTANETWDPGWKQKARNTKMGVRSGIPDFIIVFPKAVLFLELKRPDGGVVSKSQKKWAEALLAVGGSVGCALAYGYDEAKEVIDSLAYPEKNIKRTLPY